MGQDKFDGIDIYWLSESVFNLTRVNLLRLVGIPRERLQQLSSSYRFNGNNEQIGVTVKNVKAVLRSHSERSTSSSNKPKEGAD
jgi:hypothetical protein